MKYILYISILTSCLFSIEPTFGQPPIELSETLYEETKTFRLHFEYINNFIVVKTVVNGQIPLYFIFDTGAENTIFINPTFVNLLQLNLYKEYQVMGADFKHTLTAYLTKNINFSFPEFDVQNLDALVFKENYLNLDPYIGKQIAGIIGANFFKGKVLKINYKQRYIDIISLGNLEENDYVGYHIFDMEVKKSRGFIQTNMTIAKDSMPLKLMIDTGAATTALLYTDSTKIKVPLTSIPTNIANGLGGEIDGYLGRISSFGIGSLIKNDLIINFQQLPYLRNEKLLNNRDGVLGNVILDDFQVIYDNIRGRLYLKPLTSFYKKDKYDKSGLFILSSGPLLKNIEIHHVIKGSPGDIAGLKVGDKIIKLNGWGKGFLNLDFCTKLLQRRSGKKIRIKIDRDGQIIKKTFKLKDLL